MHTAHIQHTYPVCSRLPGVQISVWQVRRKEVWGGGVRAGKLYGWSRLMIGIARPTPCVFRADLHAHVCMFIL